MSATDEHDRNAQVIGAVNGILDPCSMAAVVPTGLADMGLVERVEIESGAVRITLITTSPHCMYVGHFQLGIEERVSKLDWVESVEVTMSYATVWDESRIARAARERLHARHRAPRGLPPRTYSAPLEVSA